MTDRSTPVRGLTSEQVHSVLTAAAAAPAPHNTRPWRFRLTPGTIELRADLAYPAADPDDRELVLACGAALLNLRLAIRVAGCYPDTRLCPDPHRPELLAVVTPQDGLRPTRTDRELVAAIPRQRTNRSPSHLDAVSTPLRHELRRAAETEHAWLAKLAPHQLPILRALGDRAYRMQQTGPGFRAERPNWTGQEESIVDGVSAGPLIAVIGSFHDEPQARLQAGQAMQRVLLTATTHGLAASFLSDVVEVPRTRLELRTLIGGGIWPQTVLRIGYGTSVPATARRPVEDVLGEPVASGVQ